MNCPSCGNELPQAAKFCGSCGYQFENQAAAGGGGVPATSGGAVRSPEEIVAAGIEFPPVGEVLTESWELTKPHVGILIGGMVVIGLLASVLSLTGIGGLVVPAVGAGFVIVALRIVNGAPFAFGNFFDGFKLFVPLLLLGIVQGILIYIGMLLLVLPGIYLSVVWVWSQLLVIDRGMDFWPAMEASRKVAGAAFGPTFVFLLVLGLLNVAVGIPTCYLGMLVTVPVSVIALCVVYKRIFGIAGGAEKLG